MKNRFNTLNVKLMDCRTKCRKCGSCNYLTSSYYNCCQCDCHKTMKNSINRSNSLVVKKKNNNNNSFTKYNPKDSFKKRKFSDFLNKEIKKIRYCYSLKNSNSFKKDNFNLNEEKSYNDFNHNNNNKKIKRVNHMYLDKIQKEIEKEQKCLNKLKDSITVLAKEKEYSLNNNIEKNSYLIHKKLDKYSSFNNNLNRKKLKNIKDEQIEFNKLLNSIKEPDHSQKKFNLYTHINQNVNVKNIIKNDNTEKYPNKNHNNNSTVFNTGDLSTLNFKYTSNDDIDNSSYSQTNFTTTDEHFSKLQKKIIPNGEDNNYLFHGYDLKHLNKNTNNNFQRFSSVIPRRSKNIFDQFNDKNDDRSKNEFSLKFQTENSSTHNKNNSNSFFNYSQINKTCYREKDYNNINDLYFGKKSINNLHKNKSVENLHYNYYSSLCNKFDNSSLNKSDFVINDNKIITHSQNNVTIEKNNNALNNLTFGSQELENCLNDSKKIKDNDEHKENDDLSKDQNSLNQLFLDFTKMTQKYSKNELKNKYIKIKNYVINEKKNLLLEITNFELFIPSDCINKNEIIKKYELENEIILKKLNEEQNKNVEFMKLIDKYQSEILFLKEKIYHVNQAINDQKVILNDLDIIQNKNNSRNSKIKNNDYSLFNFQEPIKLDITNDLSQSKNHINDCFSYNSFTELDNKKENKNIFVNQETKFDENDFTNKSLVNYKNNNDVYIKKFNSGGKKLGKSHSQKIIYNNKDNKNVSSPNELKINTELDLNREIFKSFSNTKKVSNNSIYTIYNNNILCFDPNNKNFSIVDFSDFDFYKNYYDNKKEDNNNILFMNENILYIITGNNSDLFYKFNPTKKKMTKLSNLHNNHAGGCLISFNQIIYCLGGKFNKKVEKYSKEKDKWIEAKEMKIERSFFSSCIIKNEFLFAFFGYNVPTKKYLNSIEYISLNKNSEWNYMKYKDNENLINISHFMCVNSKDEKIFIFGGKNESVEKFNDNIYEIILGSDFENDSFAKMTNFKLKDLSKNNGYCFSNSYQIYKDENNDDSICIFDNKSNAHIIQVKTMSHNVYNFE